MLFEFWKKLENWPFYVQKCDFFVFFDIFSKNASREKWKTPKFPWSPPHFPQSFFKLEWCLRCQNVQNKIWSKLSEPDFQVRLSKKLYRSQKMQKMPFFHSENVNQNKTCFKSEIWKRASESLFQILFNYEFQVKKQCDILQFPEKCGALSPHFSLFGGHFGSKMAARGHWSEKNCIFEKGSPRPFKWYMICYAMLNI